MKVYLVVEDYDSGPGIASLNICNIFSTEERAIEKMNKLIDEEKSFCDEEYLNSPFYQNYYRVEEWEVEE
jgi:hypothetical protein